MTGGGFGGSIVALVDPEAAARFARETVEAYEASTGVHGRVIVPA